MESHVSIVNKDICLEGILNENSNRAVVVCHPHPLYGGNMHNNVVCSIADTFFENGFTTLCFNFRGVGASTGVFDNEQGEQEDVISAVAYLKEKGFEQIWLAGYSFGSKITALVVSNSIEIEEHIMVAPPAAFMSFDDVDQLPQTHLVITGANDEIAPPEKIEEHFQRWGINPQFEVIQSCDHFYSGCLGELDRILNSYLSL